MADLFSDVLTIRDTKGGISDASTYRGSQRTTKGVINVAVNASTDDVWYLVDVPSNDTPTSILQFNQDLGTASNGDIGIYAGDRFIKSDGVVVERNEVILKDAFSSLSTFLNSDNRESPIELRFEAFGTNNSLKTLDFTMWELAGLARDPFVNLRIGIKIVVVFNPFVSGSVFLVVKSSGK